MKRLWAVLMLALLGMSAGAEDGVWTTRTLSMTQFSVGMTSSGAMDVTYSADEAVQLDELRFWFNASQASTVSAVLVNGRGTAYDFPIIYDTAPLDAKEWGYGYRVQPTRPWTLASGDGVRMKCYNASIRNWTVLLVFTRKQR